MDITLTPGLLFGNVEIIPSKSQAHRLLICAAFADNVTDLICPQTNEDMQATAQCLCALGAQIMNTQTGYHIVPATHIPQHAVLNCRESGSTLRFLLPVAGALGVDTTFQMAGRLPQRPLSPLWEEMERMGCQLDRPTADTVRCRGQLRVGDYHIDGGVSSQFITGLLLALSLLPGQSRLEITGKIESAPYIEMTKQAMELFGADSQHLGTKPFHSPGTITVEGDWSNGAFFLAAKQLGSELFVKNLSPRSAQGDKVAATLLPSLRHGHATVSAAHIPDLVPILSVVAAASHGAVFTDIARLRLKESDRVHSVVEMICSLGGKAEDLGDRLVVHPVPLRGGTVNSYNDHRIAMSAAIASTVCTESVTILDAQAVQKSYPTFWEEFHRLGGKHGLFLW